MKKPLWLHRPVLSWPAIYRWADTGGIRKLMPPDQLHMTLATVRQPVDWTGLELRTDELVIPAGPKPIQIFAWTIKALTFDHSAVRDRHAELLALFPQMDHPNLRPHISLYKGGRMPEGIYEGEIVLGPEQADEFDPTNTQGIKHVKVGDMLASNMRR